MSAVEFKRESILQKSLGVKGLKKSVTTFIFVINLISVKIRRVFLKYSDNAGFTLRGENIHGVR